MHNGISREWIFIFLDLLVELNNNKASLYAALAGLASMATVEILMVLHDEWNLVGVAGEYARLALFYFQQIGWHEQRLN